ncbi:MAG: multidrug transporter [Betaproteobacteria bacterium]|jgi:cobalt-zinc-cadmium efflux system membrane fusion protein|nr:multidrug transporter [Betaproteobacteria bacterium]
MSNGERTIVNGVLALVLIVGGCAKEAAEAPAPEPKVEGETITFPVADKAPHPETKVIAYEPAPNVNLNGRLVWDEDHTVRVFSPFAGRVSRILVQPGARVRKGQTLAVLGSPEFGQAQTEARRAETDLKLAESNLQRQKELESHGVAARKDLQVAEAEHGRARAELERARARLRMYGGGTASIDQSFSMSSPIDGVVVEKNINPGQELRPDQMTSNAPPLFVVTDPSHLWALLDASEKDLAAVEIGKTVTIRSPTYADADFPAKIVSISDFLDPATRTLKVRATLDNSHRRLKAEMFVTGEFQTRQGLRMQVPAKATFFQGGQHYVFTQDAPARYTRREVRVGDEHDGKVTILSGLQDGQRVVVEDVLMLQQMLQPRRVQK